MEATYVNTVELGVIIGCVLEVSELDLEHKFASCLFSFKVRMTVLWYLCCLGVLLQLVQLCVTGLDEAFQD